MKSLTGTVVRNLTSCGGFYRGATSFLGDYEYHPTVKIPTHEMLLVVGEEEAHGVTRIYLMRTSGELVADEFSTGSWYGKEHALGLVYEGIQE